MREIKFRGLSAKGEWIYGYLVPDLPNSTAYYEDYSQRIGWFPKSGGQANCPVKNGTVGQYTGLKDKNGVEIFEGDKIVWHDDISDIDIIKWIDKEGCWGTQSTLWLCNTRFKGNIEVIGNIHEEVS